MLSRDATEHDEAPQTFLVYGASSGTAELLQVELAAERQHSFALAHVVRGGRDVVLHVQLVNQVQTLPVTVGDHLRAEHPRTFFRFCEQLFDGLRCLARGLDPCCPRARLRRVIGA